MAVKRQLFLAILLMFVVCSHTASAKTATRICKVTIKPCKRCKIKCYKKKNCKIHGSKRIKKSHCKQCKKLSCYVKKCRRRICKVLTPTPSVLVSPSPLMMPEPSYQGDETELLDQAGALTSPEASPDQHLASATPFSTRKPICSTTLCAVCRFVCRVLYKGVLCTCHRKDRLFCKHCY